MEVAGRSTIGAPNFSKTVRFAGFAAPLLDFVNDNLIGPCFSFGGGLGNGGWEALVGVCLGSRVDMDVEIIGGTAGLFMEFPTLLCRALGSLFISLPLGLRDLRPLLCRRGLLLDGDLLSSPRDLEPADDERVAVRRRLIFVCFCGEAVGRGPKGTRLALPIDFVPPGLLSSGSFFIFLIKLDEGPRFIPAAIAPNRFCKGACDFDPVCTSAEL